MMKKILALTSISILLLIGGLYASPFYFLLYGAKMMIETGRDTAFIGDHIYFDNRVVKAADTATDWPKHLAYNRIPLSPKMQELHQQYGSVAHVVIYKDSILHESYYDGYSDQSKSNSFSMSKSFVTSMLGKAIMEGQIESLDQKVSDFLEGFDQGYAAKLTVGDLASMSSGLEWNEKYDLSLNGMMEAYISPDLTRVMKKSIITSPPGEGFRYLSGNTQLLAMVLQEATAKNISDYFSEKFWQPLGATQDALWQLDSAANSMEKAYCCFATNAKDFARMGKLYKDYGQWEGEQLLDSTFIAKSTQARFSESPEYGYGWWMAPYKDQQGFAMRGHLGQYVIVFPESDLIIVRLGHQKGPKKDAFGPQMFHDLIDEGFQMIAHVSQP